MEPAIKLGSLVLIKQEQQYRVGDIITFKNSDNLMATTTHRIIKEKIAENQIQYYTKGDANNAEDTNKVSESLIIGKVQIIIPYLGYLIGFTQTLPGIIIFIIIPAIIIIIDEINNIRKEILKKKS